MDTKDTTSAPDCKETPIMEVEDIFISIEKALTMVCDLADGHFGMNEDYVRDHAYKIICDYEKAQTKASIAIDYLWEAKKALKALLNQ